MGADRIGMAAWMLHGLCCGEEAGARNLAFFRVKWLQPAMKGTSCVRRLRFGSFRVQSVPPMDFATSGCSCVRNSMRFLTLWWQIALEWLHECCMGYDLCVFWRCGGRSQIFAILALVIFLVKILLKRVSRSSFFRFGVEIRFWSCSFRRRCA